MRGADAASNISWLSTKCHTGTTSFAESRVELTSNASERPPFDKDIPMPEAPQLEVAWGFSRRNLGGRLTSEELIEIYFTRDWIGQLSEEESSQLSENKKKIPWLACVM